MCSSATQQQCHFAANAARAADHQRNLAAELSLWSHALKLRFLQGPVLDSECFGSGKGDIVVKLSELSRLLFGARLGQRMTNLTIFQRVSSRHHMDCVDKKLRGDASFFLVFPKAEKSQAWNNYNRRVGIAKLG